LTKSNELMLKQSIIKKQSLKTLMNTPNLHIFLMVEKRYFKITDVEMHAVIEWLRYSNHLQYYKIYGIVIKMFMTVFEQLATKTLYKYEGCSQGNSLGHQPSHVGFIGWKMQQIKNFPICVIFSSNIHNTHQLRYKLF